MHGKQATDSKELDALAAKLLTEIDKALAELDDVYKRQAIRGLTGQIIDVRDPQVHEQQREGHALGVAAPVADSKGNDAKAHAVHQLTLQGKGAGNVVGSHEHSAEQQATAQHLSLIHI